MKLKIGQSTINRDEKSHCGKDGDGAGGSISYYSYLSKRVNHKIFIPFFYILKCLISDAGHFLHLRLTPTTGQRIFKSPAFSVTRENCYLEMWVHQSSMHHGSLRVVIEPQNSQESSWVPAEVAGNDYRQWQLMQFRIGRVSQDFQILFEVTPKLTNTQVRGHVSIDDVSLKGCFPETTRTDACYMAQVKCQKNKRDMCLKTVSVCDIDIDCDDKEDELLNCGMYIEN